MDRLGFVIDCERKSVKTKRTGETFQLEEIDKHLCLPFVPMQIEKEEEIMLMVDDTLKEKMKKIRKIHHIMGHLQVEILKNFYRDSSKNDDSTMDLIQEVTNDCKVCKYKYKKTPPRPKLVYLFLVISTNVFR